MTESVDTLRDFLDGRLGDSSAIEVEAMVGGGSCEIFGVQRGKERWVLRRVPVHRNSATAHDVLREFRILDAIKDEAVSIARPILACDDPDVFGAPFYVMERIDGVPVRAEIPSAWTANPQEQSQALDQLVDALVAIHAIDWQQCGLSDLAHSGPYLARQVDRWMSQLDSYHGRPLPSAARIASWLDDHRPADQMPALAHGDYKLDNVLFSPDAPPQLLAVVDWEMASIADPLIDLGWAMIFHPGPEGTIPPRCRCESRVRSVANAGALVADGARMRSVRAATLVESIGIMCSPDGSWPLSWRAATPSSCAANRRRRSTSSSVCRPTCCSRAPPASPRSTDGQAQRPEARG